MDLVFDRPLMLPPAAGSESWELAADWHLVYNGEIFRLPVGFKTDGASIPRFLWRVCGTPLDVPRLYAALVHDFLYSGGDPDATRSEADAIYRDLQIALGISRVKAFVEWSALRIFGGSHWNERERIKNEK